MLKPPIFFGVVAALFFSQQLFISAEEIIPICDCHKNCVGPQLVYLCGTEKRDIWQNPCTVDGNADLPFCDEKLTYDDRVKDLLSRIPIEEKLGVGGEHSDFNDAI